MSDHEEREEDGRRESAWEKAERARPCSEHREAECDGCWPPPIEEDPSTKWFEQQIEALSKANAGLRGEIERLRSLAGRYVNLVEEEESYDYFDGDWRNTFSKAEVAEMRALAVKARKP